MEERNLERKNRKLSSIVNPRADRLLREIEEYAEKEHVPIMEPEGIEILLQFLRIHRPRTILELGTAIGYSAIRMAETLPNARIVTIERIEKRIETAKAKF